MNETPGLVRLLSRHSVAVTIDRLDASLRQRNILVFARIDFSGDATRAAVVPLIEAAAGA